METIRPNKKIYPELETCPCCGKPKKPTNWQDYEPKLILVTKNFIRDQKEIRLDLDTIKLCEQVGFKLIERHYRKLSSQSFWRIIYKKKYPDVETIDCEDILVFTPEKDPM